MIENLLNALQTLPPSLWTLLFLAGWLTLTIAAHPLAEVLTALSRGLAALFGALEKGVTTLRQGFQTLFERTLAWEEEQLGLSRQSVAVIVLVSRVLYGLLAADILLATTALDLSSVGPLIFGPEAGAVSLPVNLPLATGFLTIGVVTLFGSLLLETIGATPASIALFPSPRRGVRILLAAIAILGSVLSLALVSLLFIDRYLLLQGYSWPLAGIVISGLQGLLSNVAALISLWSLLLGLMALLTVLLALGGLLCHALAAPFALGKRLGEALADPVMPNLINGLTAPARWLVNALIRTPLLAWLHLPRLRAVGEPAPAWPPIPEGPYGPYDLSGEGAGSDHELDAPKDTSIWQTTGGVTVLRREYERNGMRNVKIEPARASVIGVGHCGEWLLPSLLVNLEPVGAHKGALRLAGFVPTDRNPDGGLRRLIKKAGAQNVGITPNDLWILRRHGEALTR